MAKWRIVAIEHFPELRLKINECRSIMALWIELSGLYDHGLRGVDTDELKRRICKFGEWCVDAPQNNDARYDPFTSVVISLYEYRPEFQHLFVKNDAEEEGRTEKQQDRRSQDASADSQRRDRKRRPPLPGRHPLRRRDDY